MKIDIHHHLVNEPDYVTQLLREMDRWGIERVCLSGLNLYGPTSLGDLSPGNEAVLRVHEQYPERIIPFVAIRLGKDSVEEVASWLDRGFRGVKTTRPLKPYDHPDFDPVYALLEARGVPILFHTGIVLRTATDAVDDVSSDRMRPITLDRVARRFPQLTMVMAHLGVPWHAEAAMLLRLHPNLYADLTGAPGGWIDHQRPESFQEWFYWPGAPKKLLFGTDVHWRDIAWAVQSQQRVLDLLAVNDDAAQAFWGETARGWWRG